MARELTDLITEKARTIYEQFKEFRGSVGYSERTRSDDGTHGKATAMVENEFANLRMKYGNKYRCLEDDYECKSYQLECKHHNMRVGYKGVIFFILFYSILTTVITAWKTEVFVTDFILFFLHDI